MSNLIEYTRNFSRKYISGNAEGLIRTYKRELAKLKLKEDQGEISKSEFESLRLKLIQDLEKQFKRDLIKRDAVVGTLSTALTGLGILSGRRLKINKNLHEMNKKNLDELPQIQSTLDKQELNEKYYKLNKRLNGAALGLAGAGTALGIGAVPLMHRSYRKALEEIRSGKYDD